ncbi:MAG: hypothetical protein WCI88_15875 [Chloroflexota bacterium]
MLTSLFNLTLKNAAATRSLTLSLDDYVYEESDGFAMPPVQRFVEHSPLAHGAVDCGFRLLPRRLTFRLMLRATSPTAFYDLRRDLIDILRPAYNNAAGTLAATLPDATTWELSVFCEKLDFTSPKGLLQEAVFTLSAPQPVWRQVSSPTTTYLYQSDIGRTKIIPYPGSWLAVPYPFTIRGPISHPVITNQTAEMKIDLDTVIPDNEIVSIDLRQGYKTILLGSQSLLGCLSSDSDLDAFCLLPDPDAASGNNVFQLTGSASGSNTRLALGFTIMRLGL